jgi:aminoglycoside phosphotransferase (APT) family kinase protein
MSVEASPGTSADAMTTSLSPTELDGLDLGVVTAFLHGRGIPLAGPMRAELISGGKSNLTYLLSAGNNGYVLRRPPLGTILPGAHDVAREYRVMAALAGSAVPVPAMTALCADDAVMGVPFYVMEAVPGVVLRDRDLVAQLPEGVRAKLGGTLVDTLADLHEIDPAEVGLSDLGRPDGYLRRQLDRWLRQYHAIKIRDLDHAEPVAAALQASLPATGGAGIVHGDYRLDNVIVEHGDMSRVAAVLDWEMATLGDPLADLGALVMFWDEPGQEFNPITKGLTAFSGFPTPGQVVDRYVTRRGLAVDDLDWYLVFARFRLAIILEQIHVRHLQGKTRGEGFGSVGDMVVLLLAQCRAAVEASPRIRTARTTPTIMSDR